MIDPSIWADEDFGSLDSEGQIMFIGMFSNADDEGRLPGNALFLASTIMPYKGLSKNEATKLRDKVLSKMKSVILYEVDGKEYIQFQKWASYQSINKASRSKYPPLPKDYRSATVSLPPNRIEENRIEKNRKEEKLSSTFEYLKNVPLKDFEDIEVTEKQLLLEAEKARNWLKSKGERKKDYKAYLRNWVLKNFKLRTSPTVANTADKYEIDENNIARLKQMKQGVQIGRPV